MFPEHYYPLKWVKVHTISPYSKVRELIGVAKRAFEYRTLLKNHGDSDNDQHAGFERAFLSSCQNLPWKALYNLVQRSRTRVFISLGWARLNIFTGSTVALRILL